MNVLCGATPCPVLLSAVCVFYQGANLVYTGINTNDNLQTALEKIDAKFQDAGLGYVFSNGIIQNAPGDFVKLGGPLTENTIITNNGFTLTFTEQLIAGAFVTTGGLSTDFVKGDGTLDSNSYQLAGNYISSLTGDGTASGPGSSVLTLATVASAGTWGSATQVPIITINPKGLVTSLTSTLITIPSASLSFSGDVSGSGMTGSPVILTLATVNSNVYISNTFLKFAVNGKGLVKSAAPITNLDIHGVLGYIPVPNTRALTINGVTKNLVADRTWVLPDLNYVHNQSVANATWVVLHNLNKFVSVSIVDTANDEVEGSVYYDSVNQVTLTFSAAFSGKAYIN